MIKVNYMITSLPLAPLRFLSIRRTSVFEIHFFTDFRGFTLSLKPLRQNMY